MCAKGEIDLVGGTTSDRSDPTRALDPTNLRVSTRFENTVVLRQVTAQDPFQ